MHDNLPDEPFCFVGSPIQRRSIIMPATSPAKAILAAVLAALVSLVTALQDRTSIETMKALDWVLVLLAAAISGIGVYLIPNRPTTVRRRGEPGQAVLYWALVALVVVVIIAIVFGVR